MKERLFFAARLSILLTIIVSLSFFVVPLKAQDNTTKQKVTIKIDEIEQDEYIKGKVANFDSPQKYKVLVYVHTDKWYIHPYAGQDEGSSWAAIKEDGNWSIPTIKRQFKANRVAALVVDPVVAENAPSDLENIEKIKNHAVIVYTIEDMKMKGWYGKL